jgi:hypothetical protein
MLWQPPYLALVAAGVPDQDLATIADLFPNTPVESAHFRVVLSSLIVRAAYGGMACDVALMHTAVHLWSQRFSSAPSPAVKRLVRREERACMHGMAMPKGCEDHISAHASCDAAGRAEQLACMLDDEGRTSGTKAGGSNTCMHATGELTSAMHECGQDQCTQGVCRVAYASNASAHKTCMLSPYGRPTTSEVCEGASASEGASPIHERGAASNVALCRLQEVSYRSPEQRPLRLSTAKPEILSSKEDDRQRVRIQSNAGCPSEGAESKKWTGKHNLMGSSPVRSMETAHKLEGCNRCLQLATAGQGDDGARNGTAGHSAKLLQNANEISSSVAQHEYDDKDAVDMAAMASAEGRVPVATGGWGAVWQNLFGDRKESFAVCPLWHLQIRMT